MRDRALRVAVVVMEDCTPMVPIGVADLFRKLLMLPEYCNDPKAREVDVRFVGAHRRVRTAGGVPVVCDVTFAESESFDLAVIGALDPEIEPRLQQNRAAVAWARERHAAGTDLASACTGAFVLAEAGLLDRRRATTHWAFQPLFAARYPRVQLEPAAVLVDQGRICTAGGATSFINLVHFLIERRLGVEVAASMAKMFLIDVNKAPQSAYAVLAGRRDHGDEAILRAQDLIERAPGQDRAVPELARLVGMSERNFVRRFKEATGDSPLGYIQRVRVEAAKRHLERSTAPLSTVAAALGYGDPVALRKLFTRMTGMTPGEYHARYGPRSAPGFVRARGRGRDAAAATH